MKRLLTILFIIPLLAIGQSIINPYVFAAGAVDADAANYITRVEAAGRTLSAAEEGYINTYFTGLKTAGLWTKITDRGLLCWGSAAANAETFKGTNDVTWSGTITHASNGVTGDGTTGYGNTGIIPSTSLSVTSVHLAIYSATDAGNNAYLDLGSRTSTTASLLFDIRNGTNLFVGDAYTTSTSNGRIQVSNSSSLGYFHITRISSTDLKAIKGGVQIGATTTSANTGTRPTHAIYILCFNNASAASSFSARRYILWSVGSGLTTTEAADDNTLTEAFMDSMGIGVQ